MRGGEFLFVQLVLTTIGGLAGALVGWELFGGAIAALLFGVVGFVLPLVWLRLRVDRRRAAFEQGLPDALDARRCDRGVALGIRHRDDERNHRTHASR